MIKRCTFLLAALLFSKAHAQNFVHINPSDTPEEIIVKAASVKPTARQLEWQKMEITGFLHFGINTFTGMEWGEGKDSPNLFNPTNLDTDQWVKTAKDAGIKLLILTAKHHDGFCLWPTQTTEYSIKNSPYKNGQGDILKELAASCKKYGVKIGVYLSPWDRNAASYGSDAYNTMFLKQLDEVLGNYGQIDEVWFDGANGEGPNGKKQEYDWESYYNLIRKKQPQAVIAVMGPDVRWVGTETGYGRDSEWSVVPLDNLNQNEITANSQQQMNIKPAGDMRQKDVGSRDIILKAKGLVWYPAETDVSIRPGWFYHEHEDDKVKSPEKLFDIYLNSVGKNGVLLLNIPPNKEGLIHSADVKNLSGWKAIRDRVFAKNLLRKPTPDADWHYDNSTGEKRISATNDATTLNLTYKTNAKKTFDLLMLSEDISQGQRVESFEIQALQEGEWKTIGQGTTIGYKRMIMLPKTNSSQVRIQIKQARATPLLSHIGLYNSEGVLDNLEK